MLHTSDLAIFVQPLQVSAYPKALQLASCTCRNFGRMDLCQVCLNRLDSGSLINCSGACGKMFHFGCVGMTKPHFSSWSAKIGLFWFCESCRLNFDPAVYDREKTIMQALRELLIRTDSIDTRLGNYGDNLRKISKSLNGCQRQSKPDNYYQQQSSFLHTINELSLDDTMDDPINRSRSCDDTSFFEVLDEINSSISGQPDKFVVGSSKRVQIIENPTSNAGTSRNTSRTNVSTPAAPDKRSIVPSNKPSSSQTTDGIQNPTESTVDKIVTVSASSLNNCGNHRDNSSKPPSIPLKVAKTTQLSNESESFYVTPFAPDETEEEVKLYVCEISNTHSSLVNVIKLVPRGKTADDLSFVSFKVTVSKSISNVVGDPWYWPEGISVRTFEPNPKNGVFSRLPRT